MSMRDRRKSILPTLAAKAHELARAIHGDGAAARAVAAAAMRRLPAAVAAQDKRLYYRAGDGCSRPTKVWLDREQLLQQLVFSTSDAVERDDESRRPLPPDDLLVRFVKHLVWRSTRRNLFYVTLAIPRLLYGLSTPRAAELYCLLAEDGGKDDAYYRARKRVLVDELRGRFPGLVMTVADDTASVRVAQCLASFAPWGTVCGDESEEPLQLMHRLLHPPCFQALLAQLQWNAPPPRVPLYG